MPDPLDLTALAALLDSLGASLGAGASDAALATLEDAARAATPGPYEVRSTGGSLSVVTSDLGDPVVDVVGRVGDEQAEADAAFLALCSPDLVLGLLGRLRLLEGDLPPEGALG